METTAIAKKRLAKTRLAKLKKVNKGFIEFESWKFCPNKDKDGAEISIECETAEDGFELGSIFS